MTLLVTIPLLLGAAVLGQIVGVQGGGYPRDVELIEPVTSRSNDVFYDDDPPPTPPSKVGLWNSRHLYPSYVKGLDPVEEYNRRRLHVDTSQYLGQREGPSRWDGHRQLQVEGRAIRERYGGQPRKSDRMQKKVQEIKSDRVGRGHQRVKDSIKRRVGRHVTLDMDAPRRYEESDPHVFSYERAEPVVEEEHSRQASLPDDVKFFQDLYCEQKSPLELEFGHLYETPDGWEERYERQDHKNHRHQGKVNYLNIFGDGSFNAGSKRGNDQHYVEQHERQGSQPGGAGIFQKRVKWADKRGGFGEHYWDLNHVT